uniref:Uncharacterized protein n=1 Tax=Amphilophus citrinellus TaxID=61819 RepID=A0A3Q0S0D7_AMPCI
MIKIFAAAIKILHIKRPKVMIYKLCLCRCATDFLNLMNLKARAYQNFSILIILDMHLLTIIRLTYPPIHLLSSTYLVQGCGGWGWGVWSLSQLT